MLLGITSLLLWQLDGASHLVESERCLLDERDFASDL
jgi:hypothetical protein